MSATLITRFLLPHLLLKRMSENRFIITATLEGFINALRPGGKFDNCTISFKIPPAELQEFDECFEKCIAWGVKTLKDKKVSERKIEKAAPKWEENGLVKYNYAGDDNPPMFPWVDAKGEPIDLGISIWKGTVVRLIIDLKPYIYGNKVGCSLKVRGAQILKLVSSGGGSDAGDLSDEEVTNLFGEVDGFSQSDPNFNPPEDEEGVGEEGDDAAPF